MMTIDTSRKSTLLNFFRLMACGAVTTALLICPLSLVAQDSTTDKPELEDLTKFTQEPAPEGSELPLEEKDLDSAEKIKTEIDRLTKNINDYLAKFKGNQRRVFGPKDLEYNDPFPQRQRLIWRFYAENPQGAFAASLMDERWRFMTTRMNQAGFVRSEATEVQGNVEASPELRAHADYWRVYATLQGTIKSPLNTPQSLVQQAEKFINAHPEDPRGASILGFIVLRLDRFPEDQAALYRRIGDEYPETFMGKVGRGKVRQVEELRQPFEFEFTDVKSGETKSTAELLGKVVVLDFMSTFCRPCMKELPGLMTLQNEWADQGVVFIAVSLDRNEAQGGKAALLGMLEETDLDWPVFYQGASFQSDFSLAWGINRVPIQFVIDQEGNLRSTNAGLGLKAIVTALLEEDATAAVQEEPEAGGK